jgi:hypothetical protein
LPGHDWGLPYATNAGFSSLRIFNNRLFHHGTSGNSQTLSNGG